VIPEGAGETAIVVGIFAMLILNLWKTYVERKEASNGNGAASFMAILRRIEKFIERLWEWHNKEETPREATDRFAKEISKSVESGMAPTNVQLGILIDQNKELFAQVTEHHKQSTFYVKGVNAAVDSVEKISTLEQSMIECAAVLRDILDITKAHHEQATEYICEQRGRHEVIDSKYETDGRR
jgi:uncharacterized coiled-coil DUF342 family protein